jgi:FkbM family methyltransferase
MPGLEKARTAILGMTRRLRGRPRHGVQQTLPSAHLGSSYGGYKVYLDELDAGSVVYSLGIGEDISFDLGLMERVGCTVHGFDPTPRSIAWVAAQQLPASFVMHPWGVAEYDGVASFLPPVNSAHVSHTLLQREGDPRRRIELPVRRLATIMQELGHARLDVLKMDIEGAEYAVIADFVANGIRPRQLLLEFHHQLPGIALARSEAALERLNAAGYRIFDVQATGREFSLILAREPSDARGAYHSRSSSASARVQRSHTTGMLAFSRIQARGW